MIPVYENMTDEELLQSYCRSGKLVYLAELYKRYMPLVYGVALKYLKKAEDAQDAVMQLFEDTIVKGKNEEIKVFKAWLYTCTRNYCLMLLRKKSRDITVNLDDSFMDFCEEMHLDSEHSDEKRERDLQECVDGLPDKQKISVTLFFLNELSYKEVEERTGFSSKKVKSFIQNGKRNLRSCLENKGFNDHETE